MLDTRIKNFITNVRDKAAEKGIVASISLHREKSHLMRIGNNSVSLNTSERLTRLSVDVVNGKKQGSHTQMGDISSEECIQKALDIAVEKAAVATEKNYQPNTDVVEENIEETTQFDKELEDLDPLFKAEGYQKIFKECGEQYNYSGSWSSGSMELYLVTTANKNEAYHKSTDQLFNIVLKHPEKGWELSLSQTGYKKDDFSADKAIAEFKELLPVYENNNGFKVEPGEYTVAFGAESLGEILMMGTYTGFYGRNWEEKQGWTAKNNFGDKVLGENVNIVDDPANDKTFKFRFDMTGKLRKKFSIVEDGKLKGLMYDSSTAAKYGKDMTGHHLNGTSIVMKPGNGPKCLLEAVKDMDKVLYIPALHYVNLPNFNKGIFTGSSRFNAVLIEKGKIVSPIFSARVTDTFQNVLGNIKVISSEATSNNLSNTYGKRAPVASSTPTYVVAEGVKITDSSDTF